MIDGYISRPCGGETHAEASTPEDCMIHCDNLESCHGFNWLRSEHDLCSLCTSHFDLIPANDGIHDGDVYYYKDIGCGILVFF